MNADKFPGNPSPRQVYLLLAVCWNVVTCALKSWFYWKKVGNWGPFVWHQKQSIDPSISNFIQFYETGERVSDGSKFFAISAIEGFEKEGG